MVFQTSNKQMKIKKKNVDYSCKGFSFHEGVFFEQLDVQWYLI